MLIKYLKDFSLFLLLFVSFNDAFSIELTGFYIIKVTLALFVVLHFDDYLKMLSSPKSRPIKAFYIFMLVWLVITLLANIFYLDGTLTVALTRMFGFFALFVYFSYTKELDKVLYMLWAIMIFSSIVAYFSDPLDIYTFRKTGATEDPNEFAAQLLTVIFATLYLFQKNKNWFFLLISLAIFTYTLLYAGSKSSFIFLALMLLITFFVKFKTIISQLFSTKGLLATVVLVTALGIGIMNSSKAVEGLQGRAQKTGTFQQRLIVWRAGSEMIRDHFLMGVGFGEFPKVSARYVKNFLAEEARPSHNNFIKVFAESGVFSFLAFATFIFLLFGTKLKEIFQSEYYWLYLASLSAILMGLTVPSLHHKDFWLSLAILSNVVLYLEFKKEERIKQEEVVS
jgi:O-antigen ligase